MKANTKNNNPITLKGDPLEETYSFTYLGCTIKARIHKARVAFTMLRNVWREKQIKSNTKQRIFNSNVKAVLLYGSETWRITQKTQKIQTFINKCLRRILYLKWTDQVSNTILWKMTHRKLIKEEKMEVDRTFIQETSRNHHPLSHHMEPYREEAKR